MSYENIQITDPNFCIGPQAGTICTIDTTNLSTTLKIKNTSGAIIANYNLSSNIINKDVRVEYVGPTNLTTIIEGLTFFTFERVNSTKCIISRWETSPMFSELLLKARTTKNSSGRERYNATDFAIEYYHKTFALPNEKYNYVVLNNTDKIEPGTKLFLGPSTDTTNVGASESATVNYVANYIGEKRAYLTAPLTYEYVDGDPITFYKYVYVYSIDGYDGDDSKGTLFKLNAYDWSTEEINTNSVYKRVTAAKWCPNVGAIASVVGINMLFVRPYDSYQNWRSMYMGNVEDDKNTPFEVYDIAFEGNTIYKLQDRTTLFDDDGLATTYVWDTYNYQSDTLFPYSSNINLWIDNTILPGYNKQTDINIQVRDQYNVALRDVYVNLYKEGDTGAEFDPLSGAVTTDINGEAVVGYTSGVTYMGHTEISARVQGSSSANGSQYVWGLNNVISLPSTDPIGILFFQLKDVTGDLIGLRQLWYDFKVVETDENGDIEWVFPNFSMFGKSFFTSPGGDWGSPQHNNDQSYIGPDEVEEWLPMLYRGEDQVDSPKGGSGFGFSNWPYPTDLDTNDFFIGNQIKLIDDFEIESSIKNVTNYYLYSESGTTYFPYVTIYHPEEIGSLQISQLKLGYHTHWVDGEAYDYLWTYVDIDQFVFVEDAIPQFWSEKNPVSTNIWLRLRPFAFSLDYETLRMWVREVSYAGDTGYYEVTDELAITGFDAGGGVLGLEVLYNPTQDFKYSALVFVRLEVYDEAYEPNFVYIDYWFYITPDYTAPYLTNLYPGREDIDVPVDSTIYFEIKDIGSGVDLDSLEFFLNSRLMKPEDTVVEIVSRYHIKVTYTPPEELYFDKEYKVTVKCQDTSEQENKLNDSYTFYTAPSSGVVITDIYPGVCKRGMMRFEDVNVKILADGNGVDLSSIRLQVFDRDVSPKITPILYRIS